VTKNVPNRSIKSASDAESSESAREEIARAEEVASAKPENPASSAAPGKRRRGRKAKEAAGNEPADAQEFRVTPEMEAELEEIIAENTAMGKVDARQAFRRGELLVRSKELVRPKLWKGFCKEDMKISDGQARNFIRLMEIPELKERCIAAAILPSVLYELPKLPPEQREEIVSVHEAGGNVPVEKVKAAVKALKEGGDVDPDAAPEDRGGPAGLKALASRKTQEGVKHFVGVVKEMTADIDEALEPHWRGKRVSKAALAQKLEHPARRARADLQNVGLYLETSETSVPWHTFPAQFPSGSGWDKVARTLYRLGSREDWPASGDLGAWLADEVLPVLHWAAGTRPKADQAEADESTAAKPKRKRASGKRNPDEKPEAPGTAEA